MGHGIYENISLDMFKEFKRRIEALKERIKPFCIENDIRISNREEHELTTIAINLNWEEGEFSCNIGIYLLDEKKKAVFTFYTIKVIRIGNRVYSKKEELLKKASLDSIENNIIVLLAKAYNLNKSWTKEDLEDYLEDE